MEKTPHLGDGQRSRGERLEAIERGVWFTVKRGGLKQPLFNANVPRRTGDEGRLLWVGDGSASCSASSMTRARKGSNKAL